VDTATQSQGETTEYPPAINTALDQAPGNHFSGTIEGFDTGPSKFGRDVVIATIKIEQDGTGEYKAGDVVSLWLSSTVLRSQFAQLKPKVGELVRVVYGGKKVGVDAEYKNYRVTAPDRPPFEPDWSAMNDQDDEDVESL
jgi:hypothetical protein